MITTPTVLVLGAGASIDYGFPSGRDLLRKIIDQVRPSHPIGKCLEQQGHSADECEALWLALKNAGLLSVDEFLGRRKDLIPIGKAAIAAALIPCEMPDRIHAHGDETTWLYILSRALSAPSAEAWRQNKLTIVTFNYDRVVEHFLHTALIHQYNISDVDAAKLLVRTIRVVHVHGQLGSFPGLDPTPSRPFTGAATLDNVRIAAAAIRIVHEGALQDDDFVNARQLIDNAKRVVFLGFGYGAENTYRLQLSDTLTDKAVFASSYGMTEEERKFVERTSGGRLTLDPRGFELTQFLREYPALG